jgi:hypothetical protein
MEQALKPEAQGNVAVEPVAWVHPFGAIWRADNCPADIDFSNDGWIPLVPASSIASLSERLAEAERERDEHERMRTVYVISSQEEHAARLAAEHQRDELRAKLAEAREIIEPFAKIASEYSPREDDDFNIMADKDVLGEKLTLRKFRRARAFRDATSAAPMSQER